MKPVGVRAGRNKLVHLISLGEVVQSLRFRGAPTPARSRPDTASPIGTKTGFTLTALFSHGAPRKVPIPLTARSRIGHEQDRPPPGELESIKNHAVKHTHLAGEALEKDWERGKPFPPSLSLLPAPDHKERGLGTAIPKEF